MDIPKKSHDRQGIGLIKPVQQEELRQDLNRLGGVAPDAGSGEPDAGYDQERADRILAQIHKERPDIAGNSRGGRGRAATILTFMAAAAAGLLYMYSRPAERPEDIIGFKGEPGGTVCRLDLRIPDKPVIPVPKQGPVTLPRGEAVWPTLNCPGAGFARLTLVIPGQPDTVISDIPVVANKRSAFRLRNGDLFHIPATATGLTVRVSTDPFPKSGVADQVFWQRELTFSRGVLPDD